MTADLHTLTGAYVLDAVPPAEHEAFRVHLRRCGSCAREVAELRETAARLGLAAAAPPPAALRARVLSTVHATRRRTLARLSTVAAAVLLATAATLEVTRVADPGPAAAVVWAGDAARAQREVAGGRVTLVVSHHVDRAVLLAQLPPVPAGRTYQAWTVESRYRSAGVLAADTVLTVDHLGGAAAVAVTVEPAGGSSRPTSPPLATIPVP